MKFITLLTDFGLKDGYVGVMKGVIWGIAPDVQIADISHHISPQNVQEGALALSRVASYFPSGTVHIAVVDPGVGTARRPIAGQVGDQYYVGPDNGLFSYVLDTARQKGEAVRWVHLDRRKYWLPVVSNVFHGRDIFSPVGAHLAAGVPLYEVGTPIEDVTTFETPQPQPISGGWRGQVIAVDNFGNLATNLMRTHLMRLPMEGTAPSKIKVTIAGQTITGLVNTFGDREPGALIALIGTRDDLMISVVNGSAADRLSVGVGADIEVTGES